MKGTLASVPLCFKILRKHLLCGFLGCYRH
nr:MAG TPA: hypothetical protein [Caudoviricetes sp.]